MIDNYNDIPQYLWYHVEGNPPTFRSIWRNSKKYAAFMDEPEPKILDKYKMTYMGMGDYNFIEGVVQR